MKFPGFSLVTAAADHLPIRNSAWLIGAVLLSLCLFNPTESLAEELARLQRVEVQQSSGSTRLTFKLDKSVSYKMAQFPNHLRLVLKKADSPRFRKLNAYSDSHVGGIFFAQRGADLHVKVMLKDSTADLRLIDQALDVLTLQIETNKRPQDSPTILPGRESILNGSAKLVSDFDPPLKAEIPFVPTNLRHLQQMVSGPEATLFRTGEGYIYKDKGAEAAEIFAYFINKETPLRPLAWYRQGEAFYLLGKYDAALRSFREGEKRWPEYLALNPATTFYYADSIARLGNLADGRKLLVRLIAQLAEKAYAPLLLDRLADIFARDGREKEAIAIYSAVAAYFPETKAADHASLKLADRQIFSVDHDNYQPLLDKYLDVYKSSGDVSLRDNANFKAALLESLYGQAEKALAAVIQYDKLYPQGAFVAIARSIRQDLLLQVYLEMYEAKNHQGLIMLAQQNRDYLARCFSDANFIQRLAEAFSALHRPAGKLELFNYLAERDWASSAIPFIYGEIVDTAMAMGELAMADVTARGFLQRFPRHDKFRHMQEHRGEILFLKKDLHGVVAQLDWLTKQEGNVDSINSYYFLGKASTALKDYKKGNRALTEFVAGVGRSGKTSLFATDAFFALGTARMGLGDHRGAMAAYRAGFEGAGAEIRDQFLYAMGEAGMQMKDFQEARSHWGRILKEGSDPVWLRMAEQGISDLDWKEKTKDLYNVVK